jgi:hypothetical protein
MSSRAWSFCSWAARVALLAASFGGAPALAQRSGDGFLFRRPVGTLTIRGGYDRAIAGSDFFREVTSRLTLNRGSFSAPAVGADLAFTLRDRVDLVVGSTFARAARDSEYRDFVGDDDAGSSITQRTSFTRVPVTAALRYYLAPRGERVGTFAWIPRTVAPFVGAGGGAVYYNLGQSGEVIVEDAAGDLRAVPANLRSSGWTGAVLGSAGLDVSLSPRFLLTTELRYTRASARLAPGSFEGLEPLDLSGAAMTAGVAVRF